MLQRLLGLGAETLVPLARAEHVPIVRIRPSARRRGDVVCLGLTLALAGLIGLLVTGRTSVAAWRVPASYSGDALEVLAHIKAAQEWAVVPAWHNHVTRLGAPFGAEWSEYPAADDVLLLAVGQLARWTGLGVASNAVLLFAYITAAGGFFVASRWLGHRREWAVAGGLLFAFSYHNVSRGFAHLSLVLTFTVPLTLLSAWLVARSRRLSWGSAGGWLCAGTAVAVGIGNPYNLFLYVQLMGWALLAWWVGERQPQNGRVGLGAILIAVSAFVIVNADVWLAGDGERAVSLMARNYGGVEHYALKPIELLVPPSDHRWAGFAFWGQRYLRWSDWRGEAFSPYLGVFGAAGFLGLLAMGAVALLRGRARGAGPALQAGWILLFSAVGGVNALLALFLGLQIFRGTNRYSVFLLALGLAFLTAVASRALRRRPLGISVALAAVVATLGLWEEIPRGRADREAAAIATRFASDEAFGAAMERMLPAGAMVFQLPFLEFPEARPVHRLEDYELFRPYLHTSTLRFTYGGLKYRARSRWYRDYAGLPIPELVRRLELHGFAAIYLNRRGYSDNGDSIIAALAAAGRPAVLHSAARQQVLIALQPRTETQPPLASDFTFGDGWNSRFEPRGAVRWAYGPASLSYYNPYPTPIQARVVLRVSAEDERHLSLVFNDGPPHRWVIGREPIEISLGALALRPGVNRIDLDTDEPPVRVSPQRSQLHAFALQPMVLEVTRLPAPSGSVAVSP